MHEWPTRWRWKESFTGCARMVSQSKKVRESSRGTYRRFESARQYHSTDGIGSERQDHSTDGIESARHYHSSYGNESERRYRAADEIENERQYYSNDEYEKPRKRLPYWWKIEKRAKIGLGPRVQNDGTSTYVEEQLNARVLPGIDPLKGPFYLILEGRDSFRGIVFRKSDHLAFTLNTPNAVARGKATLKEATAYFRTIMDYYGPAAPHFFAFRHGASGARGFAQKPDIFARAEAPMLQRQVFDNASQALVFCEQAGTDGNDWQTLEDSVLYMARNELLPSALWSQYHIWSAEIALASGPLPLLNHPSVCVNDPAPLLEQIAASAVRGSRRLWELRDLMTLADETTTHAKREDVDTIAERLGISSASPTLLEVIQRLHHVTVEGLHAKYQLLVEMKRKKVLMDELSYDDSEGLRSLERVVLRREAQKKELMANPAKARHAKHIDACVQGIAIDYPEKKYTAAAMLHMQLHFGDSEGFSAESVDTTRLFRSKEVESSTEWPQCCNGDVAQRPDETVSSNIIQLEALVQALDYFILRYLDCGEQFIESLTLKTPSSYCVTRCKSKLSKWRQKKWQLSEKVKKKELWEALDNRLLILKGICKVSIELMAPTDHVWNTSKLEQYLSATKIRATTTPAIEKAVAEEASTTGTDLGRIPDATPSRADLTQCLSEGVDAHTASVWSDMNRGIFNEVEIKGFYGRTWYDVRVGVHFGTHDVRNLAGMWVFRKADKWTPNHAELLAAVCCLDQVIRHTLAGSPTALPWNGQLKVWTDFDYLRDSLAKVDEGWKEDCRGNPGQLKALTGTDEFRRKFSSLWTALYARVLVLRCLRPMEFVWKSSKRNKDAHTLASRTKMMLELNQRVVETAVTQVCSPDRLARDRSLIASLHKVPILSPMSPIEMLEYVRQLKPGDHIGALVHELFRTSRPPQ
ncbi:hypothetical protein FVE85_3597 [Porphyridium purpureum]|uniref:RNase H type-1 domain-containing protein n=1 Tax=Porphyridium purpureum TaxID=35688 RepID=A0A5J4YL04_PORPP|nr:hypothetical protein FVE85_3597 [Porphyridium purpureum]|eukprot:POR1753..scf249_10